MLPNSMSVHGLETSFVRLQLRTEMDAVSEAALGAPVSKVSCSPGNHSGCLQEMIGREGVKKAQGN